MQAWADSAVAKLPQETRLRTDLFVKAERLKSAQQQAAGDLSAHKKRMIDVFGLTRETIKIRDILTKCKDEVYAATIQQLYLLLDDIGRPIQLDMFAPKPSAQPSPGPDEGDDLLAEAETTAPAKKRRGRPPKAKAEAPIVNANKHLKKATAGLPLDVAQTEFENARKSAEKKLGPAQAMKEAAADSDKFLAKQKRPPKAPRAEPVASNDDDTFLDERDPERQGDYELQ